MSDQNGAHPLAGPIERALRALFFPVDPGPESIAAIRVAILAEIEDEFGSIRVEPGYEWGGNVFPPNSRIEEESEQGISVTRLVSDWRREAGQ